VIHLVVDIFRDSGMPFNTQNEEVIAYFQTHWFRQLWHQMGLWNEEDIKNAKSMVKSEVGVTTADLKS
jgi:predicted CoA-binding protein